jgi:hypothetical protein
VKSQVTVNVGLEVGSAADVVNVSASTEVLETTNATVGSVITQKELVELPLNGRNPLGLLALEPGVVQRSPNAAGTGLHVNGSRDTASNTTIDGIDANESSVSNPMNNIYRLNPDSIQEYKVTTSNPTAESGRNSGANTSIATRSGTNDFHGTAYEFLRNTDLNSTEFFANALGTEKPELKLNQFGYHVGGPIRKNKTFFFASWQDTIVNYSEPVDQAYSSTPAVYTPSALARVYRYWVANPKTPFVFNGQTITRNNVVLVDPIASSSTGGLSTTNSRPPADIRNWRNERGISDFDRTRLECELGVRPTVRIGHAFGVECGSRRMEFEGDSDGDVGRAVQRAERRVHLKCDAYLACEYRGSEAFDRVGGCARGDWSGVLFRRREQLCDSGSGAGWGREEHFPGGSVLEH